MGGIVVISTESGTGEPSSNLSLASQDHFCINAIVTGINSSILLPRYVLNNN